MKGPSIEEKAWQRGKQIHRSIRELLYHVRELGPTFTIKCYLNYFGIGIFSSIQYPIADIEVTVRTHPVWKKLERAQYAELVCMRHVSSIIKKGNVLLDVGSWAGLYTLLFSKLVKDTGRVYAFDCDPEAFALLNDNVRRNNLTNVHIEKLCIGSIIGQVKLRSRSGGGRSSLVRRNWDRPFKRITVNVTTLDKYCKDVGISPQGIKIDVEGAEALVLQGARRIIEECSPWVMLEFHGTLTTEKERRQNWNRIIRDAKEVLFIDGNSKHYHYGSRVESLPDCSSFHVFIRY